MVSNPGHPILPIHNVEKTNNANEINSKREGDIIYSLRMKGQVGEPVAKKQPKLNLKPEKILEMTKNNPG